MTDEPEIQATPLMPQSPTSMGTFETCPRQYAHKYVLKTVKYVESPEQAEGKKFHRAAYQRCCLGMSTPPEYAVFEPAFKVVDGWPDLSGEMRLAVDRTFKSVDWRYRMVGNDVDIMSVDRTSKTARVVDWKTGKPKDDPLQLLINGVTVFAEEPLVNEITLGFFYTKTGKMDRFKMHRDNLPIQQREVLKKIHRIQVAHETAAFPPKPSGLCKKWCDVMSCEHNGKNR